MRIGIAAQTAGAAHAAQRIKKLDRRFTSECRNRPNKDALYDTFRIIRYNTATTRNRQKRFERIGFPVEPSEV